MSEMVERVARAICRDEGYDPERNDFWQDYTSMARASIEAMREPTPLMAQAALVANRKIDPPPMRVGQDYQAAHVAWEAMIDEALR